MFHFILVTAKIIKTCNFMMLKTTSMLSKPCFKCDSSVYLEYIYMNCFISLSVEIIFFFFSFSSNCKSTTMAVALSKALIFLTVIIQFIATALLSFLLLGCIDKSSNYSNVFLLNYKFNLTSPLYGELSTKSLNSTSLDALSIRVGYLGVCLSQDNDLTCTTYAQLESFPTYSISILDGTLDLVKLAQSFSSICHPRILFATIVLTLVSLLLLCYMLIPLVPVKFIVIKVNTLFTFLNLLLWGLGSMLQHQAVSTSAVMMRESSLQLLVGSSGGRAEAMTWTAFSFIVVVFLSLCFGVWTEFKNKHASTTNVAPPPVMQKV